MAPFTARCARGAIGGGARWRRVGTERGGGARWRGGEGGSGAQAAAEVLEEGGGEDAVHAHRVAEEGVGFDAVVVHVVEPVDGRLDHGAIVALRVAEEE